VDALSDGSGAGGAVSSSSRYIDSSNIEDILRGASILAGGGGGDYSRAVERFQNFVDSEVEVRPLSMFSEEATIVTVFGLGPVDSSEDNAIELAEESIMEFEENFSEIDGIILGELGPDLVVEAAIIAQRMEIPVADADVAGLRAVPSIQNEIIEASDLDRTPIVATNGEVTEIIRETCSGLEIEQRIRELADDSIWYITGYPATPEQYSESAATEWYDECMNAFSNCDMIAEGSIVSLETRQVDGHTYGRIEVESENRYTLLFRNENIELQEDGEVIAEAPESITLIHEGRGVYNGEIPEEGEQVQIAVISFPEIWYESDVFDSENEIEQILGDNQ
jgi:DUF917 family protein